MGKSIVYGLGGYDPSKPNDNIVEIIDTPDEETQDEIDALIQEATQ